MLSTFIILTFLSVQSSTNECHLSTSTNKPEERENFIPYARNELTICLVSYLMSLNDERMKDEYFNSLSHELEISHACSQQIEYFKNQYVNQFTLENNLNNCMSLAIAADENLKKFLIKKRTIELVEHRMVQSIWNTFVNKKQKALTNVEKEISDIVFMHSLQCVSDYTNNFIDSLDDNFQHLSDAEELCIERELIKQGIIDAAENIDTNPKNLYIENDKCHEIFIDVMTDFYENIKESKAEIVDCKIETSKKEKYFESLCKYELLKGRNVSESKQREEKQMLIQKVIDIFKKINKTCP